MTNPRPVSNSPSDNRSSELAGRVFWLRPESGVAGAERYVDRLNTGWDGGLLALDQQDETAQHSAD